MTLLDEFCLFLCSSSAAMECSVVSLVMEFLHIVSQFWRNRKL